MGLPLTVLVEIRLEPRLVAGLSSFYGLSLVVVFDPMKRAQSPQKQWHANHHG